MALSFAHGNGKLIHDSTVHTVKIIFRILSVECQIGHGKLIKTEKIFNDKGCQHFKRCRGGQAGGVGDGSANSRSTPG